MDAADLGRAGTQPWCAGLSAGLSAEDLTQDVFVRVFRSLHRFQPGTFEGWLHRITTNLFLDGARRRQKIRFDGLGDGSAERLPSAWPNPSDQLADADLDHDVAAALSALPPEFRAAVVLCDIEASATRRSVRFLTSRSEPFEAASIAGGHNYGPRSRTADRPGSGCDTWVLR